MKEKLFTILILCFLLVITISITSADTGTVDTTIMNEDLKDGDTVNIQGIPIQGENAKVISANTISCPSGCTVNNVPVEGENIQINPDGTVKCSGECGFDGNKVTGQGATYSKESGIDCKACSVNGKEIGEVSGLKQNEELKDHF
jgi:hypothetical protein